MSFMKVYTQVLTEGEKNPNYKKQIAEVQKLGFKADSIGSYVTNLFKDALMVTVESQPSTPGQNLSLAVPLSDKLTKLIPAAMRGRYEDTSIFFENTTELKKFLSGKKSKFEAGR
tara:strand:- start:18084 stop:18428 length:345 start_codon:yes stop_codon:yes gene_type:complete